MKAKEKIFSRSFSSERRAKSPKSAENQKERNKRSSRQSHKVQISESDGSSDLSGRSLRLRHKEFLKKVEYSRKKPKSKPRVKVLPLSSASSAEEPNHVVHSTPYASLEQSKENKINEEKTPNVSVEQHMKPQLNGDTENLKISVHENELEDSVFVNVENSTELDSISKKHERTPEARKRKYGISETVRGTEPAQRQALPGEAQSYQSYTGLKPRKLFQQESIAENRAGLSEDSDSGEEGSASVVTAFENFTNELRNKFWSRYRRMSMRSRRSLSDCEKSVSTLFSFVHNCRLNNLERFQKTVMDEIHHLEKDSKSLMDIEKDTVDFWKTQAHTLASFCETQERRLKLLESTNPSTVSLPTEESVPSAAQEKTHPNKSENALLTKSPVKPI
ncbi:synaptonemal complex protein 2-like [Amia ocellicauda]|uniref:synaptonemal complex protein 2-like n=1 Tax=Amia ocellicauda TaxID=2972642 RepID=UPI003464AC88